MGQADRVDRELQFEGSSLDDLREFPKDVRVVVGQALRAAQRGMKHDQAKPLKGHRGAGVLEIIEDYDGDTYRAVYTVRYFDAVWVVHCYQKKSKRGIETPKRDREIIEKRLAEIERRHRGG